MDDTDSFFAGASRRRIEMDGRGWMHEAWTLDPVPPFPDADRCAESAIRSRYLAEDVRSRGRSFSLCFSSSPPRSVHLHCRAGVARINWKSFSGETLRTGGDTPENRIWGSGQPLRPSPFRPAYDGSRTRSNDQQLRSAQYIELPRHATRNAVSSLIARPPWPHVGASA